jgi:O-methyltransferase
MGIVRSIAQRLPSFIKRPLRASVDSVEAFRYRRSELYRDEQEQRWNFFKKAINALRYNGIEGDYAEFGCHGAMTFRLAYLAATEYVRVASPPFHLWAFDSFKGLPATEGELDEHPEWVGGTMATALDDFHRLCDRAGIPRDVYSTVAGFYNESLSPAAEGRRPSKIRLAYIDCDLYSSTHDVLNFLIPRLQHGMVIAFDDYYCWSASLPSGERLAAAEAFSTNPDWRLVPYVQFGWHGMSFVVEAKAAGERSGNHESHW